LRNYKTNMIQPEYKPLGTILTDKLFRVPEYQRHYSWEKKQRTDLFEDISKLQKARSKFPDREHFMATVVCLKTKSTEKVGSNSFAVYDIVDGQQRLTTLVILLKAIGERLDELGEEEESKGLDKTLVKADGRLVILQNNHDNKHLLRQYLESGTVPESSEIKTLADKHLADAISDCETFVAKTDSPTDVIDLLSLVKNNLFFIFQSLEDEGAVYTIFEVLNSRGLDVDWLDKCKSLLMGILYEHSRTSGSVFRQHLAEIHSYWAELYRTIGIDEIPGHEIIRFAATLKSDTAPSRPLSAEDALEYFKVTCLRHPSNEGVVKQIIEHSIWLKDVTQYLKKLDADIRRRAVTNITQARLLAVAIMSRRDLLAKQRETLLDQWERVTFRIFGLCGNDSRKRVGEYVRTAREIFSNKTHSLGQMVKSIGDIAGDEFSIDASVKNLRDTDCYEGWQNELRYFFYRFEEYKAKESGAQLDPAVWQQIWKSNPNSSIEHIWPQSSSRDCWSDFSIADDYTRLNCIGNLVMLAPQLNSSAGDRCFAEKKAVYSKCSILALKEIGNKKKWNPKAIDERTKRLIQFAREQWRDIEIGE